MPSLLHFSTLLVPYPFELGTLQTATATVTDGSISLLPSQFRQDPLVFSRKDPLSRYYEVYFSPPLYCCDQSPSTLTQRLYTSSTWTRLYVDRKGAARSRNPA